VRRAGYNHSRGAAILSPRIRQHGEPFPEPGSGSRHMEPGTRRAWRGRAGGEIDGMADMERARTLAGYDERLTELRRYL